jgi:hypothetical protein
VGIPPELRRDASVHKSERFGYSNVRRVSPEEQPLIKTEMASRMDEGSLFDHALEDDDMM